MTIADKLALLEQTKEAQRVKLGLPESMPFNQYVKFMRAWEPTDLFRSGEQGVWFDPSDLSTMFQDVDGTEPVTKDGDPVALIKDKSGNGNDAIQTTASARPIYRTDGELHWLEFDGVDDYLINQTFTLQGNDITQVLALKPYDLPNISYFTGSAPPGSANRLCIRQDKGAIRSFDNMVKPIGDFGSFNLNETAIVSLTLTPTEYRATTPSGNFNDFRDNPAGTLNGLLLFGATTSSQYCAKGVFYGYVRTSALPLESEDMTRRYLANRAGVTL